MTWNPDIAVIGAGAVGGYYGGRLAQHGHTVHFLLRGDYQAVQRNGLVVRSCDGDFTLPPHAMHVYDSPARMPPVDLVIIALKTTANDHYEPLIRPLLKPETLILTLQNGLGNEDRLAQLFGAQRVLGGLAFVCINRLPGGVIHHTDYGHVAIGEFVEGQKVNAARVAGLFSPCRIRCEVLQSLRFGRWKKLVWNIPFNGLSGILDLTTDQLMSTPESIELVRRIMQEVVAAAHANGAVLPVELIEQNIRSTTTMGAYRTSMQIDRALARPMEVEAILGQPLRAAARVGVVTPYMDMLYRLASLVNLAGCPPVR